MGTNTLVQATDGDVIPASDVNQFVTAFIENIVPRNTSRVPSDLAGQVGTSTYRFIRGYIRDVFIGTASANLKIYEGATNEIWLERDNTSSDILKVRNGSIEHWTSGTKRMTINDSTIVLDNVSVTFAASTMTTPSEYISYDSMKNDKLGDFDQGRSDGSLSDDDELASVTINTRNGFKYKVMVYLDFSITGGSATCDIDLNVGGSFEKELQTAQGGGQKTFLYVYTATSDGSKEFQVTIDDISGSATLNDECLIVEEI